MRRADRLFLIIHALRGRRTALQARSLADTLGVSQRTVYRDVADLQRSGVPIEGEAGVGYMLRQGSDIPPLMFNADELEALVIGSRFVRAFGGARMAESAYSALLKIQAVLPPALRERSENTRVFAPVWRDRDDFADLIDTLHAAIVDREVMRLDYCNEAGQRSTREIEPICMAFWGGTWTLGGWCRLRADFRNFRPDRIDAAAPTGERYTEVAERSLPAYLRSVGADRVDIR